MVASMAWNMWCLYGLNYAFAYASFYNASMGHVARPLYHVVRGILFPVTSFLSNSRKRLEAGQQLAVHFLLGCAVLLCSVVSYTMWNKPQVAGTRGR
jgi:hypothetical protein